MLIALLDKCKNDLKVFKKCNLLKRLLKSNKKVKIINL